MWRSRPETTKRLVVLVTIGMFLFLAGCATASGTTDITAENNAFNKSTIRVSVGEVVTIVFENKDNTTHNFAVYETSEATQFIFRGEALPGPGTIS